MSDSSNESDMENPEDQDTL
jgi:RIO kinase 1